MPHTGQWAKKWWLKKPHLITGGNWTSRFVWLQLCQSSRTRQRKIGDPIAFLNNGLSVFFSVWFASVQQVPGRGEMVNRFGQYYRKIASSSLKTALKFGHYARSLFIHLFPLFCLPDVRIGRIKCNIKAKSHGRLFFVCTYRLVVFYGLATTGSTPQSTGNKYSVNTKHSHSWKGQNNMWTELKLAAINDCIP